MILNIIIDEVNVHLRNACWALDVIQTINLKQFYHVF